MSTIYLSPPVGMKGTIKLAAPFTTAVVANIPYMIVGVRTLSDVAAGGVNPYDEVYAPAGITEEKYNEDLANNVCIISLQSSSGESVYIPNSYLLEMPGAAGIPYASYLVAVNIGAIPTNLDLTYFKTQLQDLANDLLGVPDAVVSAVQISALTHLSQTDSASLEVARQLVMDIVKTDGAKFRESERARLAAVQRISELEAWILANQPPP